MVESVLKLVFNAISRDCRLRRFDQGGWVVLRAQHSRAIAGLCSEMMVEKISSRDWKCADKHFASSREGPLPLRHGMSASWGTDVRRGCKRPKCAVSNSFETWR